MPTIELSKGLRAQVDWGDLSELSKFQWHVNTKSYPARMVKRNDGKRRTLFMHRQIMGLAFGDRREVDHKNHDVLDNRRRNLRICTKRQNSENRKDQSRYGAGVRRYYKRFHLEVGACGRRNHLGCFSTPEEAQAAWRKFLKQRANR